MRARGAPAQIPVEPVPATPAGPTPDPEAFVRAVEGPEVTEALRRYYRYPEGRFQDPQPPRIPTWGGAQLRMHAAIQPLLDDIARLRGEAAGS